MKQINLLVPKATITYGGMATGRSDGNTTITATTAGFTNDNAVLTVRWEHGRGDSYTDSYTNSPSRLINGFLADQSA